MLTNERRCLYGVVAALTTVLLLYSQTRAFTWDEGFHLLAAQLIGAGKRPYLDFCFPQAPLNAYWNAGWMRFFGESWHTAHALAALLTAGAILLTAEFVFSRFPASSWRLGAAVAAAALLGLNSTVVEFGTIGQAYGLCLFLIVASFRLSVLSVDRKRTLYAAAAGFFAAAAAGSSLLTAPVAPVLLLWTLLYDRTGSRWRKFAAFLGGAAVAILPVIWLFLQAPRQVIFNLVEYHLFYRRVEWAGAARHDIEVMFSWIDSPQALILGLLALAGLLFTKQPELYLCLWLTIALALNSAIAHPTFERYFLLTVPFLSILASMGFYELISRLDVKIRPFWPLLGLTILLALGLGKALYERREYYTWQDIEEVARGVDQVTPSHAPLLAEEHIYFLTRRTPPSGMEFTESQKLNLPPALAASLHILPRAELAKQIRAGTFNTVQTCKDEDDERLVSLGVAPLYRRKIVIEGCTVFWDWSGNSQMPAPAP